MMKFHKLEYQGDEFPQITSVSKLAREAERRALDNGKATSHKSEHGYIKCKNNYYWAFRLNHHRSYQNMVPIHTLVAENSIGRKLISFGKFHPDSEVVHHKNMNKYDNSPENLVVMTRKEHLKLHKKLRTTKPHPQCSAPSPSDG